MTDSVSFNFTLRGVVVVPAGSELTRTGTGIKLPDGNIIKVWDTLEIERPGDEPEDLSHEDANALGIFIDGDCPEFEGPDPINDGDTIWPPK